MDYWINGKNETLNNQQEMSNLKVKNFVFNFFIEYFLLNIEY